MKIVLDTNIIISAFIATGASKDIFEYIIENHEVVVSPYILLELKSKMTGKLGFSLADYNEIEMILKSYASVLKEEKGHVKDFSDKKDIPILDLCVSVSANLLVTGDKKLQKLKKISKTVIIKPSDFWDLEKRNFW